ncbi:hypothetical protein OIU77_010799 [Salix suchowensis]|uniref:Uncharacterized protein n=1 Tax=Salix suchowensis TaxID=1278906 RepID=A0ABQ9AAP7_9ROSI|nr:hypothetical protein OIU77_010799 [Salix suchowensis]
MGPEVPVSACLPPPSLSLSCLGKSFSHRTALCGSNFHFHQVQYVQNWIQKCFHFKISFSCSGLQQGILLPAWKVCETNQLSISFHSHLFLLLRFNFFCGDHDSIIICFYKILPCCKKVI